MEEGVKADEVCGHCSNGPHLAWDQGQVTGSLAVIPEGP